MAIRFGPFSLVYYMASLVFAVYRGDKEDQIIFDSTGLAWITGRSA